MKLKKVLAIMLCSALVATGSGVSTMAGAVTEQQSMTETEDAEEESTEAETEAVEEETTEAETEVTEEETSEAETEATEEGTTEAETEATEESTTEAETEAAEEETTEAETEATEEGTTEAETEATEEETTEDETEATDESTAEEATTEAETKVPEETEAPSLMSLELQEESSEVTVSNEDELRAAVGQSGTIIVGSEIKLTDTLVIEGDVVITLEGGRICLGNNKDLHHLISISQSADVTLSGTEIDATGMEDLQGISNTAGRLDRDYYAIHVNNSSLKTENSKIVSDDGEKKLQNERKRGIGIWGSGECIIEDGTEVSGFINGGITVEGNFTMNGGEVLNNGQAEHGGGGLQITDLGTAAVNGGEIKSNTVGVLNSGKLYMGDGEISGNDTGIYSNNEDGMTGAQFYPEAEITGGRIVNNHYEAIVNTTRSKLKISGNAEVSGEIVNEEDSQCEITENANVYSQAIENANVRAMAVSEETPYIISNDSDAELIISGGTITSNVAGEIAVWNGDTGKMSMTGGSIVTNGDSAVAVMNINKSAGAVSLTGGSISAVGTNNKILDNYGSATVDGVTIEKDGKTNLHFINVTQADGGTVILPDSMVAEGEEITVTIQPDSGYKISNVTVDGVSKGAVSSYTFKVTGAHTITATFARKSSSGGGNGGGGGGSSRSTSTSTHSKTPETPGAWLQDQTGWKFALPTGGDYLNTWIYVKGQWYRIGLNGYMLQGWVVIDGKTYYLTPVTGEMKTGWFIDNGSYYYLDSTGAVTTGWAQVNGAWYYLNADGKMAVNTTTPDGYQVGADGKRI